MFLISSEILIVQVELLHFYRWNLSQFRKSESFHVHSFINKSLTIVNYDSLSAARVIRRAEVIREIAYLINDAMKYRCIIRYFSVEIARFSSADALARV